MKTLKDASLTTEPVLLFQDPIVSVLFTISAKTANLDVLAIFIIWRVVCRWM